MTSYPKMEESNRSVNVEKAVVNSEFQHIVGECHRVNNTAHNIAERLHRLFANLTGHDLDVNVNHLKEVDDLGSSIIPVIKQTLEHASAANATSNLILDELEGLI